MGSAQPGQSGSQGYLQFLRLDLPRKVISKKITKRYLGCMRKTLCSEKPRFCIKFVNFLFVNECLKDPPEAKTQQRDNSVRGLNARQRQQTLRKGLRSASLSCAKFKTFPDMPSVKCFSLGMAISGREPILGVGPRSFFVLLLQEQALSFMSKLSQ